MVMTLMNVSKYELGAFLVEPRLSDLIEIAEFVSHDMTNQIHEKKIKLSKIYDHNLPEVMTDRNVINIVLQNLLSNALKYTPAEGKITLKIERLPASTCADRQADQPKELLITGKDNGFGIPAHQQEKIFSHFFRADNIVRKNANGTGLGLYLSKLLLEAVGGKIWFDSNEDEGSTFYVTLPLSDFDIT